MNHMISVQALRWWVPWRSLSIVKCLASNTTSHSVLEVNSLVDFIISFHEAQHHATRIEEQNADFGVRNLGGCRHECDVWCHRPGFDDSAAKESMYCSISHVYEQYLV